MITLHQLTKRFGAQTAVDALSFEIAAGQIVGFLGPNGAGKSTTLKMLTGMLEPSAGTATVCGFDLFREPLEVKPFFDSMNSWPADFEGLAKTPRGLGTTCSAFQHRAHAFSRNVGGRATPAAMNALCACPST